jgi:hypothetical protein
MFKRRIKLEPQPVANKSKEQDVLTQPWVPSIPQRNAGAEWSLWIVSVFLPLELESGPRNGYSPLI